MNHQHEFLVRITIDTGLESAEHVEELKVAEAKCAAELISAGALVALWRVPGEWANYGIWRASDEEHLNGLLATLPLRPYMSVAVQALDPHPSDPRRNDSGLADTAARSRASRVELPCLPELAIRRRRQSARRAQRNPPEVRTFTLDTLPLLETRRRSDRPRETRRIDVQNMEPRFELSVEVEVADIGGEVTEAHRNHDLFARVAGHATELMHTENNLSLSPGTLKPPIDLLLNRFGGSPCLIENAHQLSADKLLHELERQDLSPCRSLRASTVELSHSGCYGLRSYSPSRSPAPVALDIGAVNRSVGVRTLADGTEGIGTRLSVVLTLTAMTDSIPVERAARFLMALGLRLNIRVNP